MIGFGPNLPRYVELAPGVRRLLAPNPSMMTGPGTNTYLFGTAEVGVVDPGPAIAEHIDRIIGVARAPVRWILVTHTHPDHSPGAALLAERTGAALIGRPPPSTPHQDATFRPDRVMKDGESLVTGEFELEAVHTPGHASNHLCYRHAETNWLLTGDHIIDGSTVVIDPPDGNMKQYIDALRRVKVLNCEAFLPGHGDRIDDPVRVINWIIEHRLEREARVLAAVRENSALDARNLVPFAYRDVPEQLHELAQRSLLAHLLKLEEDGAVRCEADRWVAT